MIVAIDFDYTICSSKYPDLGPAVPGAFLWMKEFQRAGAKLMLWTMRSRNSSDGDVLSPAVKFCRDNGIVFWGINQNPDQDWSDSRKQYAHVYVDDAAYGCPLRESVYSNKPIVNWDIVGPQVLNMIIERNKEGKPD